MEIVMNLLFMLGGVAVFMYGMKQMSNGMEQSAGAGVKKLFRKISKNRMSDYGVGIATTALVQSSSATSIMTIGLANAGIVNVKQGSGMLLGAKVGTTLTAFLFALSGVGKGHFDISIIFSSLAFVGVIMTMTSSKDSVKQLALFFTGLGFLFLGLNVIELSIGGSDSVFSKRLTTLFDYQVMQNPILLVLLGLVFTCVIQSSTAATGVFIALLKTGVIGSIDQSFFLIMGANIGTCSDGIMASIGSSVNGKRIALFHVLTSTFGALFFTIILIIFRAPVVSLFDGLRPEWSLVIYNLTYNTIYTLILLAALNPLVYLVNKAIKDKKELARKLRYIDERLLTTPSIAIEQTLNEVSDMAQLAKNNLSRAFTGLIQEDTSESKKIADDEYQIDYTTRELASFIIKISSSAISFSTEKLLGSLHHVISDIERIGDHAVLFAKETNFMKQNELSFLPQTKEEIKVLFSKLEYLYSLCLETFQTRKIKKLEEISDLHKEVLDIITDTKNIHTTRLNSGEYSVEVSKSLYAVLLSCERISDHLINIAFSIRSNTGSKTEAFKIIKSEKK